MFLCIRASRCSELIFRLVLETDFDMTLDFMEPFERCSLLSIGSTFMSEFSCVFDKFLRYGCPIRPSPTPGL